MKVAINFTSNTTGGGFFHIQKTIEALEKVSHRLDIYLLLPKEYGKATFHKALVCDNPNRSLLARRRIRNFIRDNSIQAVYTVAGPVMLDLDVLHIVGISNAWLFNWKNLGLLRYISLNGYVSILLGIYGLRFADKYVFQSGFSRRNFVDSFDLCEADCFVIPNAVSLNQRTPCNRKERLKDGILVPMSNYSHKGFDDVKRLAQRLPDLKFYLTCERCSCDNRNIAFIGSYKPEDELKLFSSYKGIILSSRLETISGWMIACAMTEANVYARDTDFNRDFFKDQSVYYWDNVDDLESEMIGNTSRSAKTDYPLIGYDERVGRILDLIGEQKVS